MIIIRNKKTNKFIVWFKDWWTATQYIKNELNESEYDDYDFVKPEGKFYKLKMIYYKYKLEEYKNER